MEKERLGKRYGGREVEEERAPDVRERSLKEEHSDSIESRSVISDNRL